MLPPIIGKTLAIRGGQEFLVNLKDEIWATEKCRSLFGFNPDQRLDFQKFIDRGHPEDRAAMRQTVLQSLETRCDFDAEYRLLLDSDVCWIGTRGYATFDHQNRAVQLLGVSIDITARKLAELQSQKQRDDLAHLSRVTTINEMATTLAHELNQPLGAILSNVEAAEIFLSNNPPNLRNRSRSRLSHGQLTKFFERFFTTKKQGMGIGLSICKTIIEAHGGQLTAENNCDRGATLHFTLPTRRDKEEHSA